MEENFLILNIQVLVQFYLFIYFLSKKESKGRIKVHFIVGLQSTAISCL